MDNDDVAKNLARLEEAQRNLQERFAAQQKRLNRRFDRMRERLGAPPGEPNEHQRRIIDAALDLLDTVGLNDLSLRKLAATLDVKAPAIYWHFANKGVLIDYMAESILSSEFKELAPRADDDPWQDWLVSVCKRLRTAMSSRKDGARIVAGAHPYPAVTLFRIFETSQESLLSAGVDAKHADLVATTAIHFTFGRVIEEQASPTPEEFTEADLEYLRKSFPLIAASTQEAIEAAKKGYDDFEASLRLIIGYPEQ